LTGLLVERARKVVAVEVDRRLVAQLRDSFGACSNLDVVHADFLDYGIPPVTGLKVIGNLPYNISSQVLFRLLAALPAWDAAVLTTQREFAQRLLAGPGTKAFAALTVFFERECRRSKLFNIPASHFKPRPEVVSTAFRLERRPAPLFEVDDEARFRAIVKACFAQRRKTLANNLAAGLGMSKERVVEAIRCCGIDPGTRAEKVAVGKFKLLADRLMRPG
jgi:16S rRNA (adenine1518-N6/adenine1519-N6)-dimethyltransferase